MSLIFLVYPVEGVLVTDNLQSRMKAQLAIQRGKIPIKERYNFITVSDIVNQVGGRGGFDLKIMSVDRSFTERCFREKNIMYNETNYG